MKNKQISGFVQLQGMTLISDLPAILAVDFGLIYAAVRYQKKYPKEVRLSQNIIHKCIDP